MFILYVYDNLDYMIITSLKNSPLTTDKWAFFSAGERINWLMFSGGLLGRVSPEPQKYTYWHILHVCISTYTWDKNMAIP